VRLQCGDCLPTAFLLRNRNGVGTGKKGADVQRISRYAVSPPPVSSRLRWVRTNGGTFVVRAFSYQDSACTLIFCNFCAHTTHTTGTLPIPTVSVISIFVIKTELTIFATSDEAHRAVQFCAYMRLCAPNLCFARTPTIATRRAIKRETTKVERTQYYPCITVAVASVSLVALYCRLALISCTFLRRQAVCDGVIR
jgi:hypothetical protein